eukprot:XP_001691210.1 ribosomal RNA adenine methylase transferase [Chlamydomonas reinhardtii]
MWRAGSSSGSGSGDGDATASASRPMPTAAATVANLYEDRIKAKKSLGQNFMMDDTILRDIVAAAAVPELQLVHGDAVKAKRVKVVANLPYNITKELLQLLLPLGGLVSDLHLMLQHEAGERLTERTPGGREYRFRISRFKYDPVPGVDGALVTFALRPPGARLQVPSEQALMELVDKAFSERRKKMRNSLSPLYSSEEFRGAP